MTRAAIPALLALALSPALAHQDSGTVYYVGHGSKFVNIVFESQMDLETIIGVANQATGEIRVDARNDAASVELTVPVASMKTGIDLRDEHLRSEQWLDEKRFPAIGFKSKSVKKGSDGKLDVAGEFTLRGVTRELAVRVEAKEIPEEASKKAKFPEGRWIKFTTEFTVKLSDHGLKVPEAAAAKVNDEWKVKMFVFAGTARLPEKK
jgi:polyisoprenoid-binding protein YceI